MSRIGKLPVEIPAGVEVQIEGNTLTVKGPKGVLTKTFTSNVNICKEENKLSIKREFDSKEQRSLHGLIRSLVANMVKGVSVGFEKQLEIVGVGYKAVQKGNSLELQMGYSNPVLLELPKDVEVEIPVPTRVILKSINNEILGDFAAKIKAVRPVEPYKGKGIKYAGEYVRRKAGKTAK
ncbi:50S ribosomal protein L6 [Candidatus Oleimmundimicrobium sp.]|uniref:50S ribosomal protein L6 n=1 Tax=Candidatus Oleimmundimicrobium sp. TaxID=3060597 RepID=UPI00271B84DA|nr:50S ribosomal protein L6 [Candidatus Oleimmundimicrobium sp.]MDO8886048.1 50S ribosomal protein L6 [Candidatus Oleimmundimicrobium sp.]